MRDHAISEDDQATEQEMWATDLAIRAVRARGEEIQPSGVCHWCAEPVVRPKKFCDSDCAVMFDRSKR
jgi:hypothetical protein